ncbi:MAG: isocitrate/isopropylmalate family dehydrogenase [Chloroflexi bacterium]|nr:isocitrate/isopropylmalate family dehydrogenase [Chloroflexota bacterium]
MAKSAVIPGDGIANEVVPEAVKVLDVVNEKYELGLEYETFDLGSERYLRTGEAFPEDLDGFIDDLPNRFDAALFGAGGIDHRTPEDVSAMPVLVGLRRRLDLFANVRPCRLIAPDLTPLKNKTAEDINFTVIRENTEGYEFGTAGNYRVGTEDEVEIRPEYNTYKGVKRVLEFAFNYAQQEGSTRVHMAEKGLPDGLWSRVFAEVSARYPNIEGIHTHVDTLAYMMVVSPEELQVVVGENRIGDVLSDIGGAVQGSRGLAPTGCYNPEKNFCYFEPVHGTGPDILGKGVANPMAAIMASKMLLEHLAHREAAGAIESAVRHAISQGQTTPDIGGSLSTTQVGDAIRARLSAD